MTSSPLAGLESLELGRGQVALWWLGQAGFALRGAAATILFDPFLSRHRERLAPPPFPPEDTSGIDLIAISHEHWDHLDAKSIPALTKASPQARFVAPTPIIPQLIAAGVPRERAIGAQPGEVIEVATVRVHPVPACHGVEVKDAYSFGREISGGLYRYLGYVLDVGGVRVYHAGDTIAYDGMTQTMTELAVDIALLPINGRDHFREAEGIVGNMDHREAARLASAAGVKLLVPMHYEMFAKNRGFPAHLVEIVQREHPEVDVLIPGKAHPFVYTSAGGR